ncbi:hypothetical protein KC19_8G028600 [Ceratodon purpureus]|uniref:Glucosidase 2 subunit beta n=1 Tax=Ceratodon purpureus TaxID=3225 RepID=A0A8T0H042_CERPU|nr:hypothetical protein KC19_8G028600 [Ceratodon purpureus]
MKAWKEHPRLLLLPLLLVSHLHSASATSQSLGISPQDLKYFEGSAFWCRDGSKRIPKERLNDNFCDCEDGTDEPGTSACPKSKFYCKNVGYVPQSLYSSRVNDGICDCCDGSDEYDGFAKCTNTCWEAGKASREKLVKKVNVYREGLKIRRSEIESGKKLREQNDITLKSLRKEEKVLNEQVQKLKVEKESIEERERRERDAREKIAKEEAERKLKEETATGNIADQQPKTDVVEVNSVDESQNTDLVHHETEVDSAPTADETAEAPEVHLTELQEEPKLDELSKEDLGRVVASRWTGEDTTVHVPEEHQDHHSADEATDNQDHDADIDSDLEPEHEYNEEDDYAAYREEEQVPETPPEPRKLSWWERFIPGALKRVYNREPVNKSEADRIRNQYSEASTKLSTVQHQISELESKLKGDFGPEGEFYSFHEKCFELKVQKYNYKVCPFKQAIQEEGHMSTRLGNWDGFKDNYTAMMFSGGDRCWNGPDRSLRVKLRCGVRTELRNVDEPSRCDYVAELVTPTFCLESKLQELQKKLDQQVSGVHEEL